MDKEFLRSEWTCSLFLLDGNLYYCANNFCALTKFWNLQNRIVTPYGRFGINHSDPSSRVNCPWTALPLKMGPIRCPETSVPNYHSMLRKILEECRSLLYCGGSLKPPMKNLCPINEPLNYLNSVFGKCNTIDKIIYCKVFFYLFFSRTYRASWYYESFFYQLMHKWIVLKIILKFTLKLTLKQLRHVSV